MATKKKPAARKTVGNMKVTLANLSGDPQEIVVRRGASLKDVLLKAGHGADELEALLEGVRVNGREITLGARVAAGAVITIAPAVNGGR